LAKQVYTVKLSSMKSEAAQELEQASIAPPESASDLVSV